jgi:hypothetical protein
MRKTWIISFAILLAVFSFSSCQKEVSGDGILPPPVENPLLGNWKLIDNDVKAEFTQEVIRDIGTLTNISTLDYITMNNDGTLTFEQDKILAKQLSFSFEDTIKSQLYVDGSFVEAYESPIDATMPPASSSSPYVLVGTDSIYCPNGSFLQIEGTDTTETFPTGFKFVIQDDRLILTNHTTAQEEVTEDGATTKTESKVTVVTTLQKQ